MSLLPVPSYRPGQGLGLASSCGAAVSSHGVPGSTHTFRALQLGSTAGCPGFRASADVNPSTWICWELKRRILPASVLHFLHPCTQRVGMHSEEDTDRMCHLHHTYQECCASWVTLCLYHSKLHLDLTGRAAGGRDLTQPLRHSCHSQLQFLALLF